MRNFLLRVTLQAGSSKFWNIHRFVELCGSSLLSKCTTVSFTVSPELKGFVMVCSRATGISAFYDIPIRRLTGLPLASFRHALAGLPLLRLNASKQL
jgi:hypothetical protein